MEQLEDESRQGARVRFTILECDQRSPEWATARLGKLTGSRAADMLATLKGGGEASARCNLRLQLTLERITGRNLDRGYFNQAMQDGIDREPDAAMTYEVLTGQILQSSGFLQHVELPAGCSLDGHIGDFDGIVEIKSPIHATHLEYLKTGQVPADYMKQIVHNLWITGAKWCDWLSYQPDFPEPLRVKLVRVERDEAAISEYHRKALAFLAEVDNEVEVIRTMADLRGQLEQAVTA
jgi:hypothetical protein